MPGSVIDRLPPEVLCDIFLATLTDKKELLDNDRPLSHSIAAPLYISHVCRSWRKISLSHGELWSHLVLNLVQSVSSVGLKQMEEVFDTWLLRTNKRPLNFWFICEFTAYMMSDHRGYLRVAEHIIATLLSEQHRWKAVTFRWHGLETSLGFLGIKAINMPHLTSLSLEHTVRGKTCARINIAQSSRLTSLNLRGRFVLENGGGQICTLIKHCILVFVDTPAVQSCLNLLELAPSLRKLSVRSTGRWRGLPSSAIERRSLVEHHLEKLDLDCVPEPESLMSLLTLPSLKTFSYTSVPPDQNAVSLLRFFQRSQCSLTSLSLTGNCANESNLFPILPLLPLIKELIVVRGNVTTVLFRELTVTKKSTTEIGSATASGDQILCPALTSLWVEELFLPEENSAECANAFIMMVKSRWRELRTFQTILMNYRFTNPLPFEVGTIDDHFDDLRGCLEDGFVSVGGDEDRE